MKAAVDEIETKDRVTIRAKHRDEEGRIKVEKVEVNTHNTETLKHIEKKLVDTGVQRMERHSADPRVSVKKPAPKKGHGGKFTWEGPDAEVENELGAEPALDQGDPNYVDEEVVDEEVKDRVVGEVEAAKLAEAREGVARVDVDPRLPV
ncbi:uncharacterized protein LOC141639134 [Silene latifolia]|uniref:uncharacterized protein LOC141639134 n=1 Tax=Silene latifolia TaxID=37657 RepID=UPI003D77C5E0